MVAGANQRTAGRLAKADALGVFGVLGKLVRMNKALNGKVAG